LVIGDGDSSLIAYNRIKKIKGNKRSRFLAGDRNDRKFFGVVGRSGDSQQDSGNKEIILANRCFFTACC
jgi:hypothetical protein